MAEILHHLGCMKPYKWDILHINWCRISAINSSTAIVHNFNAKLYYTKNRKRYCSSTAEEEFPS